MRRFKIILPIFLGTLAYCALTICLGPRGLWPMSQTEAQKEALGKSLEGLYAANARLDGEFRNLQANPDTISVYAHELGYVAEDERLIKLAGYSGRINRSFATGDAIEIAKPMFVPEWICKFFGVAVGIAAYLLLRFFKMRTLTKGA
jgi:cell division protein FtsB